MANDKEDSQQQSKEEINKLVSDATVAIKKEMYKRFAVGIVSGAIGIIVLAGIGAWTILLPELRNHIGGVPKQAVVAFDITDSETCPKGWHPYKSARARVIVGAGDPTEAPGRFANDENGMPLTHYVRGQHGGEEKHTLSEAEMPSHSHGHRDYRWQGDVPSPPYASLGGGNWGYSPTNISDETDSVGQGQPHNNMPPYIALYFCKKD